MVKRVHYDINFLRVATFSEISLIMYYNHEINCQRAMHRLNTCMQCGGALCQNVRQAFQRTVSLHDSNNHIHHTQFQHRHTQYRTSFIE